MLNSLLKLIKTNDSFNSIDYALCYALMILSGYYILSCSFFTFRKVHGL